MLKAVAAGAAGIIVSVSFAHGETRPALGYVTSEGHTRYEARRELCYNIDCSSGFSSGTTGPVSETGRVSLQRAVVSSAYARDTNPFEWAYNGHVHRQVIDLTRSYRAYELGIYPPQPYLAQAGYCSAPTLVEHTPLCIGGQWPFYASFLYPADNPIFSGSRS